jgi:3-oxoacyl-[acyl-carrier protein] reductase
VKLLENKNAIITGGGRGIGKAIAMDFAKNGANVAAIALEKNELDQSVEEIETYGVKGFSIPADLSNLNEITASMDKYFEEFERCDILVNNAGFSHYSTVVEYPLEKAKKLFDVNLFAYYAMTKLVLPSMIENGEGKIIMTASVHGNMFFQPKKVAYSTTKAAVTALGKCLHNELKPHNIQVNVVLPGAIDTKLVQDNVALGQINPDPDPPETISPLYLFLASNLSTRRYPGKIINQHFIAELLKKFKAKISGDNFYINEIMEAVKPELTKDMNSFMRKNLELIEFMLKYK